MEELGGGGLLLQRFRRLGDQPRGLHRDDRLRGEIFEQRNFLVGEWPDLAAGCGNRAQERTVFAQRHNQQGVDPGLGVRLRDGIVELRQVRDVHKARSVKQRLEEGIIRAVGPLPQPFR